MYNDTWTLIYSVAILLHNMKITELKELMINRIANLNQQRAQAFIMGDIISVERLDNEIIETELTISQLNANT